MNLLKETLETMRVSGLSSDDIIFIGSRDKEYECSWDEYLTLADIDYDNGFGENEIGLDLIIEFKDGYRMYRGEYDGCEWWIMHRPFHTPVNKTKKITRITRIAMITRATCRDDHPNYVKEICEGEE